MQKPIPISQKQIIYNIKKASRILIATHENVDGDGLGSMIALGEALKGLGKKVTLYTKDKVPYIYAFLPGQKKVIHEFKKTAKFDLTLVVDVAEKNRVSSAFAHYKHLGVVISIDHHEMGKSDTDYIYCKPKQASCGELIYKLLKTLKIDLTKSMATNLYAAIATDTGSFKYSNTTKETFLIASHLVKKGVDVWWVSQNCFELFSKERMKLLKKMMSTIEIHESGLIAWAKLTQKDFKITGAEAGDAEGFINYPRSIQGVEVAVFFKEKKKNEYKVSLRSKDNVNVAKIAAVFSGGGHERASGCTVKGSFAHVKAQILEQILLAVK